jgi:hypothetical protein
MKNKFVWVVIIVCTVMLCTVQQADAQSNNDAALAAADTSAFSVNNQGGWQLYNSYIASASTDSIQLEIIVQHTNNFNWSNSTYVGKIKSASFYPQNERVVSFNLISTIYELKVDKNGKCYLRLVSGGSPTINAMVIPVKILYKK